MTKRKVKAKANEVPIVAEDLKVGGRLLTICPVCSGFGGVLHDDEHWSVCKQCRGDGRVYVEEVAHAAATS